MNSNTIAVETCEEGDQVRAGNGGNNISQLNVISFILPQFNMCPLCQDCLNWKLSDICLYKRIAYLFDHPGTVFYAIFMSFWGKDEMPGVQASCTLPSLWGDNVFRMTSLGAASPTGRLHSDVTRKASSHRRGDNNTVGPGSISLAENFCVTKHLSFLLLFSCNLS